MRSLTHWSRSNSRILAAQKTFSSPPSSKLRKSISPQKAKTVPFPSHARHGVRAVASDNETQKIHGEAMYTATDSAGGAALRAKNCQCAGSRGSPLVFLSGDLKGDTLFEKRVSPFVRQWRSAPHYPYSAARCNLPSPAKGEIKRDTLFEKRVSPFDFRSLHRCRIIS